MSINTSSFFQGFRSFLLELLWVNPSCFPKYLITCNYKSRTWSVQLQFQQSAAFIHDIIANLLCHCVYNMQDCRWREQYSLFMGMMPPEAIQHHRMETLVKCHIKFRESWMNSQVRNNLGVKCPPGLIKAAGTGIYKYCSSSYSRATKQIGWM